MTITMGQIHCGFDTVVRLLSARLGYTISRDVVARLRRQYPERLAAHAPIRVGGNLLGFDDAALDAFESIIREEDRCRR